MNMLLSVVGFKCLKWLHRVEYCVESERTILLALNILTLLLDISIIIVLTQIT